MSAGSIAVPNVIPLLPPGHETTLRNTLPPNTNIELHSGEDKPGFRSYLWQQSESRPGSFFTLPTPPNHSGIKSFPKVYFCSSGISCRIFPSIHK